MQARLMKLLGRSTLPARWFRPLVKGIILPAHAEMSLPPDPGP